LQASDAIVAVDTASDDDTAYFDDDEDGPLGQQPDYHYHEYGSGYPTDLPDSAGTNLLCLRFPALG